MPAVLPLTWLPLVATGHYRHMARRDIAVWERFLAIHGKEYRAVAYDVALGGVTPTDPTATEREKLGFLYSTALKIDALLDDGTSWWAIEVRPEAAAGSIGSALTYALMAKREQLSPKPIRPMIVCEYLHPDIAWTAAALNIRVVVV